MRFTAWTAKKAARHRTTRLFDLLIEVYLVLVNPFYMEYQPPSWCLLAVVDICPGTIRAFSGESTMIA